MKKSLRLSSIYMGVLTASLLTSSVCLAGNYKAEPHNYKGERVEAPCPPPPCKVLKDGFYVGAQAGYDSYRVRQFIDSGIIGADFAAGVSANPVLNAVGAVGGGFLGYGMYFQDIYYLAAELWANGSAANTSYNASAIAVSTLLPPVDAIGTYGTTVEGNWSWGVSVLPGVKLNESTLGYARLGYSRHQLKTTETFGTLSDAIGPFPTFASTGSVSNTDWYSGFQYGLGVESVFYPNWSVRGEYSHTNLGSNSNSVTGTEFSVSDNQYLLSLIYHFDCFNLFA